MAGTADSRGNGHVVAGLLLAKYPLCAAAMQLPIEAKECDIARELNWLTGDGSRRADSREEGDCMSMSPALHRRFAVTDMRQMTEVVEARKELYEKVAEHAEGAMIERRQQQEMPPAEEKPRNERIGQPEERLGASILGDECVSLKVGQRFARTD